MLLVHLLYVHLLQLLPHISVDEAVFWAHVVAFALLLPLSGSESVVSLGIQLTVFTLLSLVESF